MSLRFPIELLLLALGLAGCDRTTQVPKSGGPPAGEGALDIAASGLVPAGGKLNQGIDPQAIAYYDNAEAVNRGMRLYKQYNCNGCHFDGGGGIGPALMDNQWIYGGRLDQIYNTIYQGRPNGMPAWGGKIPANQIWEIASYVRSMSLPETLRANGDGVPSQHPAPVPRAADMHGGWQLPPDQTGPSKATVKGAG